MKISQECIDSIIESLAETERRGLQVLALTGHKLAAVRLLSCHVAVRDRHEYYPHTIALAVIEKLTASRRVRISTY